MLNAHHRCLYAGVDEKNTGVRDGYFTRTTVHRDITRMTCVSATLDAREMSSVNAVFLIGFHRNWRLRRHRDRLARQCWQRVHVRMIVGL